MSDEEDWKKADVPDARDDPHRDPGFTITECWMFVARDQTGAEGLIGSTMVMEGREVFMPLVATDKARRDSLYAAAVRIGRVARQTIHLIRLSGREELGLVYSPKTGKQ